MAAPPGWCRPGGAARVASAAEVTAEEVTAEEVTVRGRAGAGAVDRRVTRLRRAALRSALVAASQVLVAGVLTATATATATVTAASSRGRATTGSRAVSTATPTPATPTPATPTPATATATAAACTRPAGSGVELVQRPDGVVSGCWLVGPRAAGTYHVALSGYLGQYLGGAATGSPVAVTLSSSAGRPGSVVIVHGRLLVPEPARSAPAVANVCVDGCDGLVEDAVALHWLAGGGRHGALPAGDVSRFIVRAELPDAPFFVGGRLHSLVSGVYPIGVACVAPEGPGIAGCGEHPAQGSAPFHLVVAHPVRCTVSGSCAHLELSPPDAPPGTAVRVRGVAPVSQIIGQPFGYTLTVGRAVAVRASVPAAAGGVVELAPTAFRVEVPELWAQLPSTRPLDVQAVGPEPGPVSLDASDSGLVATCAPGAIRLVSVATGGVVRTVPTRTVDAVHFGSGVALWPSPAGRTGTATTGPTSSVPRSCVDVLADPGRTGDVFAAFDAAGPGGAPPVEEVGAVTTDGGAVWHAVPAPQGSAVGLLSGFAVAPSGAVDALFVPAGESPRRPDVVEASADGGAHWSAAPLGCPAAGPCLTLGPFAPGNCAMNGTSQELLVSTDGGRSFADAGQSWPGRLDACGPAEVAGTSARDVLVVDSSSPFLVVSSTDGGRSFADVGVPALRLPGADGVLGQGGAVPYGSGGLVLLPDGSLLLATGSSPARAGTERSPASSPWYLLRAGATSWCSVGPLAVRPLAVHSMAGASGTAASGLISPVVALAGRLWWSPLQPDSSSPTGQLESVALSAIGCS